MYTHDRFLKIKFIFSLFMIILLIKHKICKSSTKRYSFQIERVHLWYLINYRKTILIDFVLLFVFRLKIIVF